MAFFTPGSGNSLFVKLYSLFSQGSMRLWEFLIWHFDQHFFMDSMSLSFFIFVIFVFIFCYFMIFDFLVFWIFDSICLLFFEPFCPELGPGSATIGFSEKNYIGYSNSRPNWRQESMFYEHVIVFPAPPAYAGHSLKKQGIFLRNFPRVWSFRLSFLIARFPYHKVKAVCKHDVERGRGMRLRQ